MKFLIILMLALPVSSFAQEISFIVSVGNDTIIVSPNDDNTNKIISLNSSSVESGNYITITVLHDEIEKDWQRSFIIFDSNGSEISRFMQMKGNTFCILIKKLTSLLSPDSEYEIYTTALPKDPQKAMMVKVARQLVCKVKY